MFKEEILGNENRRRVYSVIEANPGIHMRELQRVLDMPLTTLEYHLTYMSRKKILFKESDGHYNRYYVRPLDSEDKKILSALRQKRMREIVFLVLKDKIDLTSKPTLELFLFVNCPTENIRAE